MTDRELEVIGAVSIVALLVLLALAVSCHAYTADAVKACAAACGGSVIQASVEVCKCR